MSPSSPVLHVRFADPGWIVTNDDERDPLSTHSDASAALRAASVAARALDAEVVVHDRYHRSRRHRFPASPTSQEIVG